jgi:hypothetical protein
MSNTCTIWVCQDCMLHHANGECGSCHLDEGHDRDPMGLIDRPMSGRDMVTMGMLVTEHPCDYDWPDGSFCDCEIREFSWSSCDGCGSTLGGERHAFTMWFDED